MANIYTTFNLYNVFAHIYSPDLETATYSQGTTRLDYTLATKKATNAVRHCG